MWLVLNTNGPRSGALGPASKISSGEIWANLMAPLCTAFERLFHFSWRWDTLTFLIDYVS